MVVALWFVHLLLVARQAASLSRLRGQVYFTGFACSRYRDGHGNSILADADELGVSWRVLILQIVSGGEYYDPSNFDQLDTPSLLLSDPNFDDDKPGRLTHMFLVRIDGEVGDDGEPSEDSWVIVHLPNHAEEWTLPGILSLDELEAFIKQTDDPIDVQFYAESHCFGTITRHKVEIDTGHVRLLPWINRLEFTD